MLLIMTENQGVCNWAVRLDGSDDPPVVVEVDSAPNDRWQPYTSAFSAFIFCRIWDNPPGEIKCFAQDELSDADLELLKRTFTAQPTTHAWPGDVQYRFQSRHGRILLWDSDRHGTDWRLHANTPQELAALLSEIWHCGNLRASLYTHWGEAQHVLDTLRAR
jgi:hypothetical protein